MKYWSNLGVFGLLLFLAAASPAGAGALDLTGALWEPYTAGATGLELSNITADVPNVGTGVTVLKSTTAQGTGFGFVQKNYWALPNTLGRFATVTFRSTQPLYLYFMVVGSDGANYYLTYSASKTFVYLVDGQKYVTAPRDFPSGTANVWRSLWFDLQSDLNVLVPGVNVVGTRWVAVRGALEIAQIAFHETLPGALATDADGDGLQNTGELGGILKSNPFRRDSDADGAADVRELACGTLPLLAEGLGDTSDPDNDGLNNLDEETLQSCRLKAHLPGLGQAWETYSPAAGAAITYPDALQPGLTVITHADPLATKLGVVNPPTNKALRLERDQIKVTLRPEQAAEDFVIYVRVEASNGLQYYLLFPRFGPARSTSFVDVEYLVTPLESTFGYDFANGPAEGTPVYLDLTAQMRAFPGHESLHVRHVRWVAVRGRLTLRDLVFPPEVRLPALTVSSGSASQLGAHSPLLGLDANLGTLCKVGVNACTEYQWSDIGTSGLPFGFPSGNSLATVVAAAPTVLAAESRPIRLRVRQTTPQRPAGIWTEGTVEVLVKAPPAITGIAPASAVAGAEITLSGADFLTGGTVTIDGIAASVVSWSDTSIVAVVPGGAQPGSVNVVVAAGGDPGAPATLNVEPYIAALSPVTAPVGHGITLTGTGFGNTAPGTGGVLFGTTQASVVSWSNTSVVVTVPAVTAGLMNVVVQNAGGTSAPKPFTAVDTPYVLTVTPNTGTGGNTLTVQGYGFGASQGGSKVTIAGITMPVVSWSDSVIQASLPNSTPAGLGEVRVDVVVSAGGTVQNYYTSSDVPKSVPDFGTAYSVINVPTSGAIVDFNVWVNISQSGNYIGDLKIDLRHPDGTQIILRDAYGSGSSLNTTFDTLMSPTQPLSTFNNKEAGGEWRLIVTDRYSGWGVGTINGWSLSIYTTDLPIVKSSNIKPVTVLPTASSFNTSVARAGDSVTLTGTNFGTSPGTLLVGGTAASWTAWTSTSITFTAPALESGTYDVSVVAGGLESNALSLSLRPNIATVSPVYGPVGTVMTLTGSGFGVTQGGSSVDVGGSSATVQTWSDTSITLVVPAGLAFGPHTVTVIVNSLSSNVVTFNVGARIDGLSPSSGTGGDAVTISGDGFGATQGPSTVTLSGVAATVTAWSETSILVEVPAAVTGGTRPFRVNVGGFVSNSVSFVVTPTISGVSPANGSYGNSIAVSGTNFGAGSTVSLGGVAQTVQTTTFTQINFSVTNGIPPGAVTLLVTSGGQVSNNGSFTVIPSAVSLSPSSGTTATNFTLFGQNFGTAAGTLTVGGAAATIVSWGASQVVFTAPLSLGAGVHDVVLSANGQSTQAVSLTLRPAIMQVNPGGSPVGSYVTLTGTAFGGSQGANTLTLGGVALTAATWTTTSITFVVPMNAPAGPQNIVVTAAGQASNTAWFNVFLPRIDAVAPATAVTGSTITLTGRFDTAATIATGGNYTCAITSYGGVKCWGENSYGQLGDGTFTPRLSPVDVVGLTSGVKRISARNLHTCALTNAGAVKCWGYNASGQVGDGTTGTNRNSPVQVSTLTSGVASIGTGDNHTCALMANGGVKCWGYNLNGSVGDGSSTNRPAPVNVSGLLSGASSLEVGGYVSCAVVAGALKCWGYNGFGEIGDNTTTHRFTPTNVSGMASGVSNVSLGTYFSCAVKTTGAAMCWGRNNLNQIGDGTITNRWVPTTVSGLASGVTSITTGQFHACVRSTGGTKCWGRNTEGQIGDNTTITRSTPVPVFGLSGAISALALGSYYSCAQINANAICWGSNDYGQFGTGNRLSSLKPIETLIPGKVFFGVTPARVTSWSQTAVTVEVPALAAGSYPVTVMLWGDGSNSVPFQVKSPGTIADVSPANGTAGDTFTISGAGFEAIQGASTVTLGGVACTVLNWYEDTITATVPATAAPGVQPLVVTVNGAPSTVDFTVIPVLGSVSPLAGSDGDVLTLTGASFGAAQGVVTVGGAPAAVQSWSASLITVVIPGDAPAGLQPVEVVVGGQLSNAIDVDITPVLTTLTPAQGAAGATVTIAGSHFGDTQGTGTVSVGGVGATVTAWSMRSIAITVPDVAVGSNSVVVTAGGGASNAVALTVVPAIISLSPTRGPVDTLVTVIGTGFGAAQGPSYVDVGGVSAAVQTWSDNAITIAVPGTLTYGTYDVTAVVNLVASNAVTFNVSATLASVTPEVGSGGDSITLAGAGLGASQGLSSLNVGGVSATVTSWSDTQVIAEVPTTVAAGTHDITATVQGISTNAVTMTVKPKIVTVTPASVTGGDTVTIQGVNFGGTPQTVTIGGISVAVVSWSPTSIQVGVPATLTPGAQSVAVTVGAISSNSAPLQVLPKLVSVSPVTAPVGATVVVTGTNLGASSASGSLEINGVPASVVSWSAIAVAVTVPNTVPAGAQPVQAIVNGTSTNLLLLDVQPFITGHEVIYAGSVTGISLLGASFGASSGASQVFVSGSPVTTSSWSDSAVTAWLPSGADIAGQQVWIRVANIRSNIIEPVSLQAPWIDNRFPSSGSSGTVVTLVGSNFGSQTGSVTVGGQTAAIQGWTATTIQIQVPAGTPKGSQPILVNRFGHLSNAVPFTMRGNDVWLAFGSVPEARRYHSAVWTGREMVIWGGTFGDQFLGTGARYNPQTDTWLPIATQNSPATSQRRAAVWTGSEMIVWGCSGQVGGRYNPSTDTWSATALAGAPSTRCLPSAIWTGNEMIVWGGSYLNTGGRYNPSLDSWVPTAVAAATPSGRSDHAVAWTGNEMLVWGGHDGSSFVNTGAKYDPVADLWQTMTVTGAPVSSWVASGIWTGQEMIVFNSSASGMGRYDPVTDQWQPVNQNSGTIPFSPSMVWSGAEAIFWGGTSGRRYDPQSDAWAAVSSVGAPSDRSAHSAIWTGTEMIVWGGGPSNTGLNTGARYNPAADTWSATAVDAGVPAARTDHSAVWTGSAMIVWGGQISNLVYFATGGRYYPTTDTWLPTTMVGAPGMRRNHSAVWATNEMVVWGGQDGVALNNGGRYNPSADSWTATSLTGAPGSRFGHTAVWGAGKMFVWGGHNLSSYLNTGAAYDPVLGTWTPVSTSNAPGARDNHRAVWANDRMVVWGGSDQGSLYLNTGGRYFPASNTWATTSLTNAPAGRRLFTAHWAGSQMLVWGGSIVGSDTNTGYRYDPVLDVWSPMSVVGAPTARRLHTSVWTGTHLIVWGGRVSNFFRNDGGTYHATTDTWAATTLGGQVPAVRSGHTAVWTGGEMLIWGGLSNTESIYQSGAAYVP